MTKPVNKRKFRKLFILFITVFITAVVLVVETYAWFVGITTVNVDEFQISVTGAQGLELSLNGQYWTNVANGSSNNKLTISKANIENTDTVPANDPNKAYPTNTNIWPTNGLKPLSSAGELDTTSGNLKIYEKSSLSATQGGYRLIANKIDNTSSEQEGYIAFDLFIRNGKDLNWSKEGENIYLTKNSSASNNNGTNHGVANSVRVGFFLISGIRSSWTSATPANITALSCSTSNATNYVKYCTGSASGNKGKTWHIWEPNYNVHTSAASSYFTSACKKRDASTGAYLTTACTAPSTAVNATTTYPIQKVIDSSENADIYDGLNGYTGTTSGSFSTTKPYLAILPYRVDSSTTYTESNPIFKIAGNAIIKVRVYIWLEGQDIDNYDVIAGDTIQMNFGFTKDRYGVENT